MANRYRNLIYSTAEYTQLYKNFSGVELNGSKKASTNSRLSYMQNMYKDYESDGADAVESVPGFRQFAHYGERVHALYYQRSPFGMGDHIIVHVGNRLMRHPVSDIYEKNATGTELTTLEDTDSFGFEYGRYFYVMDTKRIIRISDSGECVTVGDGDASPYVPTTYVNGEAYEQRNLLTSEFKEEYYVADSRAFLFTTKGLKYTVTDPALRYCCVSGLEKFTDSNIYIPAYVNIDGVEHKVISVGEAAFKNNDLISEVYLPEGVVKICPDAFSGCTSLCKVVTKSTMAHIDERAFSGCASLNTLYLGESVSVIGSDAFKDCDALSSIHYSRDESEFAKINGKEVFGAKTITYDSIYNPIKVRLPLHEKVDFIKSVTINETERLFSMESEGDSYVGIILEFDNAQRFTGVRVVIEGTLAELDDDWLSDTTSLKSLTPKEAIVSCRIAEVFDGRIFFSGNPDLPNTVFYTERTDKNHDGAIYVGRYNYFNDGIGTRRVNALLSVRDMLAVFKEGDDGAGSIFYHKKQSVSLGAIDTVYPVAYVHSGLSSVGRCLSFLDDPVFLTTDGLLALDNENLNYQRNICSRSHNVNHYLQKEDLSKASLCEWLGYLVVGVNGKVFLADSRASFLHITGSREYEWFYLRDVGAYKDDVRVYRYSYDGDPTAEVCRTRIGEKADYLKVHSRIDGGGVTHYYTVEDGKSYRVLPTEEMDGGEFFPATLFISHGKLLFFATDDGHICVFNNDMKGVAPESVKASPDYSDEEYRIAMGDRLHPLFYSFAGHAPRYEISTALDDCGIPHLTKSTVKKSLVIKAKSYAPCSILCEVKSDESDPKEVAVFPAGEVGFDDFDFTDTPWYKSRYVSTPLPENEKRWIEKQISLTSEKFASPISLYSITYRYTIRGKIKNNT